MKIEIIGPGCPRCQEMHRNILNACAELGLPADIEYITDIAQIAEREIMSTPALLINGEIIMTGRVPSPSQAKEILLKHKSNG